jgi:hypothetical protein
MDKVVRDGKVAVLYSPGFGAGWYTWNVDVKQCLFHPKIVELIEQNKRHEITDELCESLFCVDSFFSGGADSLRIEWLPEGTRFFINEYDGSESIETVDILTQIA